MAAGALPAATPSRDRWANRLDENRMLVTEKAFGFLIAAIAVQLIFDGWPLPT